MRLRAEKNGKKRIDYDYDLVSGKVNTVSYQHGKGDQFYYKYDYDADNRVVRSYSSRDKLIWTEDASYTYYLHGPLARTELGQYKVQGIDYAYTLQGWLKGINSYALDSAKDIGQDSKPATMFARVSRDVYGFSLGYYNNDYTPVGTGANAFALTYQPVTPVSSANSGNQLFNGNISYTTLALSKIRNGTIAGYTYNYDQLNRLTEMNRHNIGASTWDNSSIIEAYKERISYDANGNILKYLRHGADTTGMPKEMDSLNYVYHRNGSGHLINNRLNHVKDSVGSANYTVDIDNQSANNYTYDRIGNLVSDAAEHLDTVRWTVYGKINRIVKTNGGTTVIDYGYDPGGNRTYKRVNVNDTITSTFYVRDAQGNVMGIYSVKEEESLRWDEQHLYGSSRLGMWRYDTIVPTSPPVVGENTSIYDSLLLGSRTYELSNHLGNVLSTISDKKIGHDSSSVVNYYIAEVLSQNDYYPFGMMMVGRKYAAESGYRYGFNGKENDNEVKGEGNQQDYGFRIYDPRIGKFLSVDPLTKAYPWYTPYQFAGNKPINSIDLDGLEEYSTIEAYKKDKGAKALTKMDGSDGAWLESDRKAKNSTWSNAMEAITKGDLKDKFHSYYIYGKEIKELNFSFGIVRDYYNWVQNKMDSKGYESRWARGASYLVDELSINFDGGTLTSIFYNNMGVLLKDLNQGIANFAVGRFNALFYSNQVAPNTKDAWYDWDNAFVRDEQFTVAGKIYQRYNGTKALNQLNNLARKDGMVGAGAELFGGHYFPSFKTFGVSVNNPNDQYGASGRHNIAMLMIWPMTHQQKSGATLTNEQIKEIWKAHNSINSYYQNAIKN